MLLGRTYCTRYADHVCDSMCPMPCNASKALKPERNMYFTSQDEELVQDIKCLRRMVSQVELHPQPCLLLASQLTELHYLSGKLSSVCKQLAEAVNSTRYKIEG